MSCKFHNPYHLQHNQQPRKNRIITEDKNGLFYIEVKNTVKPVLSGYRDETSTFIKRPFRNYATVGILAPYWLSLWDILRLISTIKRKCS